MKKIQKNIPHINFKCSLFQVESWNHCKKLIWKRSKEEKKNRTTDEHVRNTYSAKDCNTILKDNFPPGPTTEEELEFPVAYAVLIYKGAPLVENLLRAIYKPHNVYCIHIDIKAPKTFRRTINALTRCLKNVFVTKSSVNVIWGHISVVQAQLNCMRDLLQSPVKWKYYINLVGQDFPLYDNRGVVHGLKLLQGDNSIMSYPVPNEFKDRAMFVHRFRKGTLYHSGYKATQTSIIKKPPPHGIKLFKGPTHVALTREFAEFVLFDQRAKDFYNWLNDTLIPDEAFYASLQRYPGVPGGRQGKQVYIMRSKRWPDRSCWGYRVRDICWLDVRDLRWVLSKDESKKLFVQKIPFDYDEDLMKCLKMATNGRRYGRSIFP